jgi:hypothetical protein
MGPVAGRLPIVLAGAAAVALGCGALGPPPLDDGRGPRVVSAVPGGGALGVAASAHIVITFDRPMESLATRLAFQSTNLPAPLFEWDAEHRVMTVIPGKPLEYAAGTDTLFEPKTYSYSLGTEARDARGNNLTEALRASFSTLRRATLTLKSDARLDGYVRADGLTDSCQEGTTDADGRRLAACVGYSMLGQNLYRGLLTFDIQELPDQLEPLESARLMAYQYRVDNVPYQHLGVINVEHIRYEEKKDAYQVGALRALGLLSDGAALGWKQLESSEKLIEAIREDRRERALRGNRSQYRLVFSNGMPGPEAAAGHVAKFYTRGVEEAADDPGDPQRRERAPRLEVTGLIP